MATRWHDTPKFTEIRDARVETLKSTDDDAGIDVCKHQGLDYFMKDHRGDGHFMCRACCEHNVECLLLSLDEPPAAAG